MDDDLDHWVTYSGDAGPVLIGPSSPTEAGDAFFRALTRQLLGGDEISSPAVTSRSDGTVILAGVVRASSHGVAIDRARALFAAAIAACSPPARDPSAPAVVRLVRATAQRLDSAAI